MITISIQRFLLTGEFGPIRLGMSRAQICEILGEPDTMGGTSRRHRTPSIWTYGDIEFHFELGEDYLTLIYADDFEQLRGNQTLDIDPWIVRGGLPLDEFENHLTSIDVQYIKKSLSYNPDAVGVLIGDQILVTFAEEEDGLHLLYAISYSEKPWL